MGQGRKMDRGVQSIRKLHQPVDALDPKSPARRTTPQRRQQALCHRALGDDDATHPRLAAARITPPPDGASGFRSRFIFAWSAPGTMNRYGKLGMVGALGILAGCSVGPNYHPPKVAAPAEWGEIGSGGTTNGPQQLVQWWKYFRDPELDSLVARAVKSNLDLQAAEAHLRAARALRGSALADFLPTIDLVASYTKA